LVASRRIVWIKIFGLPIHVWEEEAFKQIGSQFGDFLDFDEDTISLKRLDVTRVKIVTNRLGLINDHLVIQVVGSIVTPSLII